MEVARVVSLARGRDYLDVTHSGFLVRGGRRHGLAQSVSVVNLITASWRRWSNCEQVPLTAETQRSQVRASTLADIVLPVLCFLFSPPFIRVISLYFHRCLLRPHSFICLCLSGNQSQDGGLVACGTYTFLPPTSSPSPAYRLRCVTFTDLHSPRTPSPPSCLSYPFDYPTPLRTTHLFGSFQPKSEDWIKPCPKTLPPTPPKKSSYCPHYTDICFNLMPGVRKGAMICSSSPGPDQKNTGLRLSP